MKFSWKTWTEHKALSRWIGLRSRNLARADDQAAVHCASTQTREEEGVLMVQGWMPSRDLKRLDAFVEQPGLALLAEPALADEIPPTLMDNPPDLSR